MKHIRFILFLLIAAGVAGCSMHKKTADQWVSWVESPENGLRQTRQTPVFDIVLQYKPAEYVALHEFAGNPEAEGFEERLRELESKHWFDLTLNSQAPIADPDRYFDFGLQQDIFLYAGPDAQKCVVFHHEQGLFGSGPGKYLLGFTRSPENQIHDLVFTLDSRHIAPEPIVFTIQQSQLEKTPILAS